MIKQKHIDFVKYQGAGNDFVILGNMNGDFDDLHAETIALLCDRKFGVGADGLMLLSHPQNANEHFRMEYFNQDGSRASFCGNGARCLCSFAFSEGYFETSDFDDGRQLLFSADDGPHTAICNFENGLVTISIRDVDTVQPQQDGAFVLDTGVPHYVRFVEDVDNVDIQTEAPQVRFADKYKPDGVNVNFVQILSRRHLKLRTYERGVEAETLACGTGITASAIAANVMTGSEDFTIDARGGQLQVSFAHKDSAYKSVRLTGPARLVFRGHIDL